MSTHASAQPHHLPGSFFPSVTTLQDNPGYPIDAWIFASAGMLDARTAPRILEELPETSEWRFGDLTLTREIRRAGQPAPWLQKSLRARRRGCVVLLRRDGRQAPAALVMAARTSLAMAALARPAHYSGEDCEMLTLFLPQAAVDGAEPEASAPVRHLDTAAGPGALLAGFMQQLAGQLGHIHGDRATLLAVATRALVEACTAPASPHASSPAPCLTSSIVERTRLVVQRHMASPGFGPPQLARLLAMSRSKLYRLLDGDGGVAHFINRERLGQAWRDLTAPGEAVSVHAIANQVGFRDHSTFSRAFRREYGCSPTEARERALLAEADSTAIPSPDPMRAPVPAASASTTRTCGRMG